MAKHIHPFNKNMSDSTDRKRYQIEKNMFQKLLHAILKGHWYSSSFFFTRVNNNFCSQLKLASTQSGSTRQQFAKSTTK
jgi:hypothetical protein